MLALHAKTEALTYSHPARSLSGLCNFHSTIDIGRANVWGHPGSTVFQGGITIHTAMLIVGGGLHIYPSFLPSLATGSRQSMAG